ncbi:MAG: hypothetical protein RLZZ396_2565, partial [Planctomycetota bacterium]
VDNVTAMVDLGVTPSLVGSIVNSTTSDAAIRVHATNSTITTSSAGAAAMVSGNGSSVGLAGAVAMVLHSSDVQAAIRNATLGAYSIDILATNQRRIGSVAAGGSGMRAPNRNAWTANLVGSFAKNDLRTSTQAQVSNIVGLRLGSVTTKAIETDVVWSASGSFQFNLQFDLREDLEENPRDAKPSKSYGFGMAISQQYSDATTVAEIVNSELTTYAGGVLVHANQAAQYYTFAASAAAGSLNVQGEGMFVKVDVDSMTYATIHGGTITIDPDPSVKESDLGVLSSSNPLMITGAGDLVLSTATTTAFAAGVAVAVVSGAIESGATIKGNATIRSKKGNARVTAQSLESLPDPRSASVLENVYTPNRDSTALWTFVVGVVSAKSAKLAADFSVIKQSIESNRSATIEGNCAITLDRGNLIVESIDEADMYSGAGAIANAGGTKDNPNTAAAGAAFNRTSVSMGTLAEIVDSNISVTQDPSSGVAEAVQVYSESKSSVWNFAVGAEVAGNAGIGDSVALSDVNHTVQASVGGVNKVYDASTVPSWTLSSVGGVSVVAKDSTELVTTAGQVAIATRGVAGGAAAATSASNNRVQAAVYGYKVTVPVGKLNIDSNSTSTLKTIAIGVSGAGKSGNGWPATFSGVVSGTGNTLIRQVESKIALSEVTVVGAIDIHASDLSDVLSIAGVADFQVNGASKVSVAAGTSAATNEFGSTSDPTKVSYVRSWIEGSSIRSQGGIDIEAVGNQKLKAWTAAGAGRYTNESDQILGFNGAGSGSGNTIQLEVSAIVDESTIVETSSDGKFSMKLMATNEPSILAVSGGVTVAGAKANGSGVKIDIGAAATTNRIDYTTLALIRNKSKILTSGSLTLEAQSSAHVEAVAYGVASSIKKSADGTEWDFTGAGTASLNTIHSTTQASVLQDSQLGEANKQLASVRIAAIDQSSITAGSGGLSSLFSFGETGTFGLSVGVSYSINEVRGKTLASVERAKIYSAGDVDVESEFSARNHGDNIRSISVAGSADLDVGSGILFPLVGAGNKNTVEMQVLAQVADGSIVDSYGELRLNASDTSKLYTNAGGVGLNLIFNKADISGGIAIGAARAQSDFGNTVQSTIDSSQTRSRHATKIHSESLPSIEAVAYGVALSVDVTSMAVSAAGSGASLVQ